MTPHHGYVHEVRDQAHLTREFTPATAPAFASEPGMFAARGCTREGADAPVHRVNSRKRDVLPRCAADPPAALPGLPSPRRNRSHAAHDLSPGPAICARDSQATRQRTMPPWFADPRFGHFANDPSLTPQEIATLSAWADAGAPAGNPHDAPPPRDWARAGSFRSLTWWCACPSRWRSPRMATWNTPMRLCPPASPKTNGFRCRRSAPRAAPMCIMRWSTFARPVRSGCAMRPWACPLRPRP